MAAYVYRPKHPQADEFGMVEKSIAGPSPASGLHIISDHMADTWHPADGKYYDSKSTFRSVTKAHGCVEIGNEKFAPRKPPRETPDRAYHDAINRAIYEIQNPWARRS